MAEEDEQLIREWQSFVNAVNGYRAEVGKVLLPDDIALAMVKEIDWTVKEAMRIGEGMYELGTVIPHICGKHGRYDYTDSEIAEFDERLAEYEVTK